VVVVRDHGHVHRLGDQGHEVSLAATCAMR
jgi:hypothetical protein